jgi:hypothetical protein
MYLVDTNVVSELRKGRRADSDVVRWARVTPLSDLYLSVVSAMELEIGVLLMERRDPSQGAALRRWLESDVLRRFGDRLLPIDLAVARACAGLQARGPWSRNDAYIGATAMVHGLTVVTRNITDFSPLGVAVFNPWQGAR